jgi:hypothetical protein
MNHGYAVWAPSWSFLTNHARALLCIARDRARGLRDIRKRHPSHSAAE